MSGEAGRELDAKIAEKVMGWRRSSVSPFGVAWFETGDEREAVAIATRDNPTILAALWSPSTDISAAMQVAEKMRERGFRFEALSPRGTGWQVRCFPVDVAPDGYQEFKGVLPLAICLAALAAISAGRTTEDRPSQATHSATGDVNA